ncbi:hypothetical protein O181_111894 [Austropuccinia psidii MF-1]|uniref:Uncharacterized protein n=1 Tax=Austropuccinia psidii MF-1 TaxID=1389203 RepID=A0A9Q3PS80_9BASI|nr:hypothetical protein [Austropuccinia psidii MF-1]
MAGDEIYASSPLVHKEKVTGHHHPYASKPKTAHASSSREKIVNDKDENMSPTQSERNDELRRDNFMAHEQGTQSNSEFTHPQMPLAQSILDQSKMRQRSNEACKTCKPEGATKMAESGTSRKCPWDEISCTCPLSVPTQFSEFPKLLQKWAPQARTKVINLGLGELMEKSVQRVDVYGV